ncbi:MAG: hypothetical protein EP344_18495 [Bacteroidetes bacterium]|nr:MAG: hypothetical protein EP344_18495 [Bacteroidota bacterium]
MLTRKQIGFSDADLCMINSGIEQTKGHELTHILCAYRIRPLLRNRLINEGAAVAFDQTERNRIALAQSANRSNLSIREIMEQADGLPDGLVYPVGGALIEFLREHGRAETLKQLLYEQTYAKLVELYGETLVREFEQQIRYTDGNKD